jgi:hypothetical protein
LLIVFLNKGYKMQKFQRLFSTFVSFCRENKGDCDGMTNYRFVDKNMAIVTTTSGYMILAWNGISWTHIKRLNDEGRGLNYYHTEGGAYARAIKEQTRIDGDKLLNKKVQTKLNDLGIENAVIEGDRVCLPADKFLSLN